MYCNVKYVFLFSFPLVPAYKAGYRRGSFPSESKSLLRGESQNIKKANLTSHTRILTGQGV